jgi:hypothetical protein
MRGSSQERIKALTEQHLARRKEYRDRSEAELAARPTPPKSTIPRRLRFLFWCINVLGRLQARLSRMTGQTLYCSQDGRTTLVSQMDDKHLKNAVRKMEREQRTDWMYDCLVKEQLARGMRLPNLLKEAADKAAEEDKPWWKKVLRLPA